MRSAIAALVDPSGQPIRAVDNGDGTSSLGTSGAVTLLTLTSTAQAAANPGTAFATGGIAGLAVDVNVTVFTGGTSPSVTFFVDRLGVDGVWYRTWTSSAISTVSAASVAIGPWPTATGVVTAVLTQQARLGWTFSGAPTSITFSASVVGR